LLAGGLVLERPGGLARIVLLEFVGHVSPRFRMAGQNCRK
jgi:hypothetical protein